MIKDYNHPSIFVYCSLGINEVDIEEILWGIEVNSKGDVSLTINKLKEEAPLFFINLEKGNTCLRSLGANGARLVKGMPLKNI